MPVGVSAPATFWRPIRRSRPAPSPGRPASAGATQPCCKVSRTVRSPGFGAPVDAPASTQRESGSLRHPSLVRCPDRRARIPGGRAGREHLAVACRRRQPECLAVERRRSVEDPVEESELVRELVEHDVLPRPEPPQVVARRALGDQDRAVVVPSPASVSRVMSAEPIDRSPPRTTIERVRDHRADAVEGIRRRRTRRASALPWAATATRIGSAGPNPFAAPKRKRDQLGGQRGRRANTTSLSRGPQIPGHVSMARQRASTFESSTEPLPPSRHGRRRLRNPGPRRLHRAPATICLVIGGSRCRS